MNREYPDRPIVGVGGVIVRGSSVLLVRRGREPLRGEWSIPGGAVELGETLRQALVREVREETGLEVEVGPVLGVFDSIFPGPGPRPQYHYVLIDFLCHPVGGLLRAASDASEARWVTASELAALEILPKTRQVIRQGLAEAAGNARHNG
jgi:mutator protein MutT